MATQSSASYVFLEGGTAKQLGISGDISSSFFATSTFIYTLLFVAIVVAAFYRYTLAGIWRMEASSTGIKKSNDELKRVSLGLLGVFTLFLILFTVNKGMLTGDVGLGALKTGNSAATGSAGNTGNTTQNTSTSATTPTIPKNNDDPKGWGAIENDPAIRSQLKGLPNGGISVNKRVCNNPTQTSCTTVGGLPSETLSMLSELRSTCSGNIMITGGTENGHASHGIGKTPVDLSINDSALETCIRGFPAGNTVSFCKKTYSKFGYTFCDERGTPHWHVYK